MNALAFAVPSDKERNMGLEVGGILGLIGLVLAIWAILNVVQSGISTGGKVLWIVVLLVLPIIGFIAWLFFGPRKG
jgi:hypothetical protein